MSANYLPVFIKPVVGLRLGIERVSEVRWSRRGDPEHLAVGAKKVVCQFLVLPLIILLHNAEISRCLNREGSLECTVARARADQGQHFDLLNLIMQLRVII